MKDLAVKFTCQHLVLNPIQLQLISKTLTFLLILELSKGAKIKFNFHRVILLILGN